MVQRKMMLNLRYPPTPAAAPQHAELCVTVVKNVEGVDLDYSIESLELLDRVIEGFQREGNTSDQVGETLFTFGCYVGEVFARHAGGRWVEPTRSPLAAPGSFPLIELSSGTLCNPIGKVFKRLDEGPEHSLPYFFHVFTSRK